MQTTCSAQRQDLARQAEMELVAEARQDPGAFRRLYELHARPVYRYLYSLAGTQADAEDLTSQVFLQALESLDQFRNQGGFRAWLFAIARSKAMDAYRKHRRELPLDDVPLPASDPDPLASVVRQDAVERMHRQIAALSEEEQELIRLRFVADLSFAEMGAVLGRSEAAVKKATYRLLARLGDQMEAEHE